MSEFFKILKASKLGDPYPAHGKNIQTWWCQMEGLDKDVSIGKIEGTELRPGQHVYGDLVYAKSKKGTEYWKFKTAQVPEGVARPTDDTSVAPSAPANEQFDVPAWFIPFGNMITGIHKHLGLDSGPVDLKDVGKETTPEEVSDMFNEAEEINLDDIPF